MTNSRSPARRRDAIASIEPGTNTNSDHAFTWSSRFSQITPSRSTKTADGSGTDKAIGGSYVRAQGRALAIERDGPVPPSLRCKGQAHVLLCLLGAVQHERSAEPGAGE